MARKVILDVDPGVGDALAICLALAQPELEVVAVTATGGNVSPRQASRNVQAHDRASRPAALAAHRLRQRGPGAADRQPRAVGRRRLCAAPSWAWSSCTSSIPSMKVLSEEIRAAPGEVTVIAGGPLEQSRRRVPDAKRTWRCWSAT